MNTEQINQANTVAQSLIERLSTDHQCGYFDGGCFTLASAVNAAYPATTQIFHISRNESVIDHAVIYLPEKNLYFDADGLQTREELFKKMVDVELCPVTVCAPLPNEKMGEVFTDIALSITDLLKSTP